MFPYDAQDNAPIPAADLEEMIAAVVDDLLVIARHKPATVRILCNVASCLSTLPHDDDDDDDGGTPLYVPKMRGGREHRAEA